MGELLLSQEVVIMLLLLHGSLQALLRSGEEDCEQAASCHKLPASFPPYCNIDSFKHLSEKVHVSPHFPHLIKTHTLKWRDINNIDFMRLHQP